MLEWTDSLLNWDRHSLTVYGGGLTEVKVTIGREEEKKVRVRKL